MEITVAATIRKNSGRGSARENRRNGMVPAIIYGACEPLSVACSARELAVRLRDEAFRSTLLTLDVEGRKIPALLREVQMHPYKREIIHIDFQAVSADSEVAANVPLHFIGVEDSPGVKLHRAIFTSVENQVAIHCLPKDLPEFINIDSSDLDIGKSIHLSEIAAPQGVRFDAIVRGEDPVLAVMSGQTAEEEPVDVEDTTSVDEEAAGTPTE